MQITIKTLDKTSRVVEGVFNTIRDVSEALGSQHGLDPELQQLIFAGKMLKPSDPLPQIPQHGFFVLTMRKPKQTKPAETAAPAVAVAVPIEALESPALPEPSEPSDSQPEPSDSHVSVEVNPEAVEALKSMGFDEDQSKLALQLANGNVEVAGAMLMDPEMMLAAQHQGMQTPQHGAPGAGAPEGGAMTEDQVVQLMEENPEAFQQLMGAIMQQQPQAAQLAQENPQAFVSFLTQVLNQSAGQAPMQNGGGNPAAPSGGVQVQMTEEEAEAMSGLKGMFPHIPEMAILQTFKACGSDAAMAANLLFDYDGETVA
eukprot:TRINITY_DN2405_c0_g1_i1.p1 TRINITY_DN2405_c0_g1~~TRINITY_DN2405_c0_g1_i1.p1  ORF type:complete len:315 (+),score=94.08 TRINITY_DN2405_c0_g1_i1:174-1118(+)